MDPNKKTPEEMAKAYEELEKETNRLREDNLRKDTVIETSRDFLTTLSDDPKPPENPYDPKTGLPTDQKSDEKSEKQVYDPAELAKMIDARAADQVKEVLSTREREAQAQKEVYDKFYNNDKNKDLNTEEGHRIVRAVALEIAPKEKNLEDALNKIGELAHKTINSFKTSTLPIVEGGGGTLPEKPPNPDEKEETNLEYMANRRTLHDKHREAAG